MVGVFVADGAAGTRDVVTGAGEDGVFRHGGMETALGASWAASSFDAVEVEQDGLLSDLHCAADCRGLAVAARSVDFAAQAPMVVLYP
jgi:carbon-monoxide dehydrogenase medium subunit